MNDLEEQKVWYKDGLRFTCTQCGDCCCGAPGYVWVDQSTIDSIAEFLELSQEAFTKKYIRRVGHRWSLIEKPNYDCIFWESGKGCTVYPVRPLQCQTFPFWPENLKNQSEWKYIEGTCPGSGRGKLYPVEMIQKIVRKNSDT